MFCRYRRPLSLRNICECQAALQCFLGLAVALASCLAQAQTPSGFELLGRGVNFGNMFEVPRGANWGVTYSADYPRLIKSAGFDTVRIPVRWSAWTDVRPPYQISPEFMKRVRRVVDACLDQGLKVVLNVHHFEELYDRPADERQRFLAIWKQLAVEYSQAGENLFFEFLNEPHQNLTAEIWNPLFAECLAEVRKLHPQRWVVVGPDHWSNIQALKDLKLPEQDRRLIVTVHYYLPFNFTHQGASWVTPVLPTGLAWNGSQAEMSALRKDLEMVADWAEQHERPMYIGEFGAYESADLNSRVRWTRSVREVCEELGMAWGYWELAAGFGIMDPQNRQWKPELVRALLPDFQ